MRRKGRTHPGHMQSMGHRWDSPGGGCWRRWNAQTGCEQLGLVLLSKPMETQNGNRFTHRCFYKKACFITQYRGSSSRLCVDPYSSAGQRMSEHCIVIIPSLCARDILQNYSWVCFSACIPLCPVSWVPCITTVYILFPSYLVTYNHMLMSSLTVLKEKQVKSVMVWNQSRLISWWGFDWSHYFSRSLKLLVPHTKKDPQLLEF